MTVNGLPMPTSLKTLPILALLAWAPAVAAQDATEAPAEDPATAEAEPAAPAEEPAADAGAEPATSAIPSEGLSMGEPADGGEPQVGQPYVREVFGDWELRCLRTESGADPCQLYQLLLDEDGNAVAEISMFPLGDGGAAVAGAEIVAPLMTLLTEDLTLSVDGTAARRYPFSFCNAAGCVARVGFTAEEVNQFRRGNAGQLSIVPAVAPDQTVDLAISLSGFTAGYQASEAAVAAAREAAAAQDAAPVEGAAPAE
jgi:invasion protein IalB